MTTKKDVFVRNIDINLWNWFVGSCKQKGKTVGEVLDSFITKLKGGK